MNSTEMQERVEAIIAEAQNKIIEATGEHVQLVAKYSVPIFMIDAYEIRRIVAKCCGVTEKELAGETRTQNACYSRHLTVYLIRTIFRNQITLKEIRNVTGQRDHTTVLHSYTTAKNLIDTQYWKFMEMYTEALERVNKYLAKQKAAA